MDAEHGAVTPGMVALDLEQVDPEGRAGVALDRITAVKQHWERENRRPWAITADEAVAAISFDLQLLCAAALGNVGSGKELTERDRTRVRVAVESTLAIIHEALS